MLARRHARWRVVLHSKMANMRVLAAADVLVVDALGVMGDWYAVADVAFVGGSLVDGVGGHNVMEPALLGCMPVCGPYTENGQHLIDALRSVDPAAICQVRSPSELSAAVVQVLRSVRHVDEGSYSPVRSAAQAAAEQVVLRSRLVLADAVDQFLAKQC
jgi:3-deoxy-D-manno-octulosonic-acid transferase